MSEEITHIVQRQMIAFRHQVTHLSIQALSVIWYWLFQVVSGKVTDYLPNVLSRGVHLSSTVHWAEELKRFISVKDIARN